MAVVPSQPKYARVMDVTADGTAEKSLVSAAGFIGSRIATGGTLAPGATIMVRAFGKISTVDAPGSLTVKVYFPNNTLAAIAQFALKPTSHNDDWHWITALTVRVNGAGGSFQCESRFSSLSAAADNMPLPQANQGIDTSANASIDLSATFDTDGNSLTMTICSIELLPAPPAIW